MSNITPDLIEGFLSEIEGFFLDSNNWKDILLTRKWAKEQPGEAGVYALIDIDNRCIVYVGESGSISGRIMDMMDSRNHTVLRKIGDDYYSTEEGFLKATAKKKFPKHIENMVKCHIKKYKLSVFPVSFGRKEVEEHLCNKYSPILNTRLKRESKKSKKTNDIMELCGLMLNQ